jgi:hypothetical protein
VGEKWEVGFVGCFVFGLVGVWGFVLGCLAKKNVSCGDYGVAVVSDADDSRRPMLCFPSSLRQL